MTDKPWFEDKSDPIRAKLDEARIETELAPMPELELSLSLFSPPRFLLPAVRSFAVLGPAILLVVSAKHRMAMGEVWVISFGVVLVAMLSTWWSTSQAARRVLALALAVSLVVSLAEAQTSGLSPLVGLKCLAVEVATACLPMGVSVWFARRYACRLSRLEAATAAAAGALAGFAALLITCPVPGQSAHLFCFHSGGVFVACTLGILGARWAKPKPISLPIVVER